MGTGGLPSVLYPCHVEHVASTVTVAEREIVIEVWEAAPDGLALRVPGEKRKNTHTHRISCLSQQLGGLLGTGASHVCQTFISYVLWSLYPNPNQTNQQKRGQCPHMGRNKNATRSVSWGCYHGGSHAGGLKVELCSLGF